MHYAFGFTGNGVGPSQLAGRTLASLALDRRDELTRLPIVGADAGAWVPPEPLAWLGGAAVRSAHPAGGGGQGARRAARPAQRRRGGGAAGARNASGALSVIRRGLAGWRVDGDRNPAVQSARPGFRANP